MAGKIFFTLRYLFDNPPWDTGITPPEVLQFLADHAPGRALDLGCGTGTNVITLAQHGWRAAGVDFVPRAIKKATKKARRAGVEVLVQFSVGDVLSADSFRGEYDLILDIGCFHSFPEEAVEGHARNLADHLVKGGSHLLYTHINPGPEAGHGATEEDLAVLGKYLTLVWRRDGEEFSRPSAWLEFRKE
jgi:cyclopropane fatty-acyl-phospholipid synthase-like methyltransferase